MKQNRGDMIRLDITVIDSGGNQKKVSFDAAQIAAQGQFDFNSSAYGGEIQNIEMEIEYPDGSKKIVGHGPKWADITHKIIIDENLMTPKQRQLLGNLPDWKNNPAMIRQLVDGTEHTICLRPGHSGDDQTSMIISVI